MSDNKKLYEQSHPWLTFSLNLQNAPFNFWLLLGAAESKCKHLAGIPLSPQKQDELNHISIVKGIQATTAIEGNTLAFDDIDKIVKGEKSNIPISYEYQKQEVQNVLDAYNSITYHIQNAGECDVSVEALKKDNSIILRDLKLEDGVIAGEIRTYPVHVKYYYGAPAEDCEYLLNRLFIWIHEEWGLNKISILIEGILKAIVSHLYIAWIHPFGDGNGRCARALEFRLLLKSGVPLIAAHLLTTYYNETRQLYYEKLEASSHENDDIGAINFIHYALQGFVDALDKQINNILKEQIRVTWKNYVHENCFGGKLTMALRRRRDLLLEISEFDRPVSVDDIRHRMSIALLKLYQGKVRALMRDLNYLENKEYLQLTNAGYEANKEKIKAFLPFRLIIK